MESVTATTHKGKLPCDLNLDLYSKNCEVNFGVLLSLGAFVFPEYILFPI